MTYRPIITGQALEEIRGLAGDAVEHGATVAVYTDCQGRSCPVAEAIECGMVGVKESGHGREG